jgi:hypothetical protein
LTFDPGLLGIARGDTVSPLGEWGHTYVELCLVFMSINPSLNSSHDTSKMRDRFMNFWRRPLTQALLVGFVLFCCPGTSKPGDDRDEADEGADVQVC